ncbi:MAG: DUF4136 domain-containing protein [Gammaproteobacteria bacterium]|nr:DUF4136 domain-containing protein [Gammaproteobacteria bacterium]
MSRIFRTGALLGFVIFMATGCSGLPTIAADVTYCCHPAADDLRTFRVEFEDTPEFLKPMLRDEASIVLATHGLDYTEGDAESILLMTFINKTLERGDDQEAWERIAPGGGVRFIAQVVIEMKDSVTGELIWSGTMQRIHNVYEGSYMHDAPAKTAMRNAFLEMFADFPNRDIQ